MKNILLVEASHDGVSYVYVDDLNILKQEALSKNSHELKDLYNSLIHTINSKGNSGVINTPLGWCGNGVHGSEGYIFGDIGGIYSHCQHMPWIVTTIITNNVTL